MILSLTEKFFKKSRKKKKTRKILKKSITTADEPPRDSNSIDFTNIHNNSNKSSEVSITNDDRC